MRLRSYPRLALSDVVAERYESRDRDDYTQAGNLWRIFISSYKCYTWRLKTREHQIMEYQPYSIRQLLDSVNSGSIRIPAFQRGFVWEMDKVAYLMDSIYKRYPFGSLLFWRTKSKLAIEKKLGQFELPEPREDYPIDYVLDGQQRLTSIFSVFQTELKPTIDNGWLNIYFDLEADENVQESQFIAVQDNQVIIEKHFH